MQLSMSPDHFERNRALDELLIQFTNSESSKRQRIEESSKITAEKVSSDSLVVKSFEALGFSEALPFF